MQTDHSSQIPSLPRVCYEIFVRSFCDSNGDGIGDLNGIRSKLDYLQDLGVEALWLTPIQPSTTYHKYDVKDYYEIDPEYGTLDDFRVLLHDVHRRGMKLYLDLVVNHTSVEHPWFQEARTGPDSPYRNFYWWMAPDKIKALGVETREETADAHEIFPWHDVQGNAQKYYAMFWNGMPDLNYDSAALREEVYKIVRYWLKDIGVDGFRLDAARHIYPYWVKEKNPAFWEEFGRVVRETRPDGYTVGEVWAKAEEVAPYFKGLTANFHFDLCFALQKIMLKERNEGLIELIQHNHRVFGTHNSAFVDATMLSNHDQIRTGSLAGGNIVKMKLAASLLLTLPGQPYLYYGEEIGMLGVKPDPRIREPFLWTDKRQDPQRALWIKPKYSRRGTVRAVSLQALDPDSLLNHYKTLIALRKQKPALGQIQHPNLEPAGGKDQEVVAYLRPHPTDPVLVYHNVTGMPKIITLGRKETAFTEILFQTNPSDLLRNRKLILSAFGSMVLSKKL
jgi:alpha-amylase